MRCSGEEQVGRGTRRWRGGRGRAQVLVPPPQERIVLSGSARRPPSRWISPRVSAARTSPSPARAHGEEGCRRGRTRKDAARGAQRPQGKSGSSRRRSSSVLSSSGDGRSHAGSAGSAAAEDAGARLDGLFCGPAASSAASVLGPGGSRSRREPAVKPVSEMGMPIPFYPASGKMDERSDVPPGPSKRSHEAVVEPSNPRAYAAVRPCSARSPRRRPRCRRWERPSPEGRSTTERGEDASGSGVCRRRSQGSKTVSENVRPRRPSTVWMRGALASAGAPTGTLPQRIWPSPRGEATNPPPVRRATAFRHHVSHCGGAGARYISVRPTGATRYGTDIESAFLTCRDRPLRRDGPA